jgi:hypothetical protein
MEYLEHEAFMAKYFEKWDNCKIEHFKLEVLPEYDEFGIDDWSKVDSQKTNDLIIDIQKILYARKEEFAEKIIKGGMEFMRVRYLPFPLTKYLLIELSSYATSQSIGAKIEIIEDADLEKIKSLMDYFCDFLLFDDTALFKIDNPGGIVKCGAYYTENQEEIAPYIALKKQLKQISQPLDEYLRLSNIQFVNSIPYVAP